MRRWNRFPEITNAIQLVAIDYDYRDVVTPIVDYIEHVNNVEFPDQLTTVVIPEFIPENLLGHLLHNQTANSLRFRLRNYRDIVVIDLPFHIEGARAWRSQQKEQAPPEGASESVAGESGPADGAPDDTGEPAA